MPKQFITQRTGSTPIELMKLGFTFDVQRGNLTNRSNSAFAWNEGFAYDNLDRLLGFQDNNGIQSLTYDARGRIATSNMIGSYTYSGTSYQQTGLSNLTDIAKAYYQSRPQQQISYNAFKAPVEIQEQGKERISFQYNSALGRSAMYYGSDNTDKLLRPLRKYYSEDGSWEIKHNQQNNTTSFILYIGGDAYTAPAIYKEEHTATAATQNLYYLHRDYLGSILMITDYLGAVKEKRVFDAWGNIVKLTNGSGTALAAFVIMDRGYTGHEHLTGVGLIHMNGRLYDPILHRFVAPDNFVQDPTNTQNFNRYGYVLNNPLKYTDPSGEFFFTILAAIFCPPLLPAAIGADIGMWSGGSMANGTMNPLKWDYSSGKTWGYMLGGAVTGGLSGGAAGAISTSGMAFANTAAIVAGSAINSFGTFMYTAGQTDFSVSFGAGSFNFSTGEFGYWGKKGNSFGENLGYGMGAIANLKDVNNLINMTNATLFTQKRYEDVTTEAGVVPGAKDYISHSGIIDKGTGGTLMSFGPKSDPIIPGKIGFAIEPKLSTTNYDIPQNLSRSVNFTVNKHAFTLARGLGKLLPYQGLSINCVNMSSLGLWLNGIPNIGIHPIFLHASMAAYNLGVRPDLYSHFLNR